MSVAERGDRDAVREVEIGATVGVVQPVTLAVAPRPLEVAAEDGRQVRAGIGGHGRSGLLVDGVGRVYRPAVAAPSGRAASPVPAAYDAAMVDFTLTDENRLVQQSVRAFAESRDPAVHPRVGREGRGPSRGLRQDGRARVPRRPDPGGVRRRRGWTTSASRILCEELERADTSFRVVQSVHVGLNSLALLQWGSEEQRQRWLVPQARGEKLATFGLTEPGVGTDAGNLQTTARRDGDAYRLNGQKIWISLADIADHFLVFASVDRSKKHKGVTAFMLERGMAGLTTGTLHGKLGIRAGNTGLINLDDVPVPVENRIGEEGEGFLVAMSAIDQGRFTVAAGAVGLAQACLDASVRYAHERQTFGVRRSASTSWSSR